MPPGPSEPKRFPVHRYPTNLLEYQSKCGTLTSAGEYVATAKPSLAKNRAIQDLQRLLLAIEIGRALSTESELDSSETQFPTSMIAGIF